MNEIETEKIKALLDALRLPSINRGWIILPR